MKTKRFFAVTVSLILSFSVFYLTYRVYHARQLNLRLESFMAEQIIPIQDKWFSMNKHLIQSEYFIHRNEAFYIYLGKAAIEGFYDSYWVAHNGTYQQLLAGEWFDRLVKDPNGTLSWMYTIRPLSGSSVCIMLEAHQPGSSVGGASTYVVDTSKSKWQLEPSNLPCRFGDTELFRTALLTVR
jgi:hypothetical protein